MGSRWKWSLRLRLSLFFAVFLIVAGLAAALFSWRAALEHINAFFDTQQMLFAQKLATAHYDAIVRHLPGPKAIMASGGRGDKGEQEDDALAFAVFSPRGELLLSDGDKGRRFVFTPGANGFMNTLVDDDFWRLVWLTSLDGHVVVAVGQELEYRDEMVLEMLAGQMLPWLFLLPTLLGGLIWMLNRELTPLRLVAVNLGRRNPDDVTPLDIDVQSEISSLVRALNSLFARMGALLQRERVFIANAAHELRTPLAGLSIQAQVASGAKRPETRAHALAQLRKGINRASRLTDQLLILFRLESLDQERGRKALPGPLTPLRWGELLPAALEEVQGPVEAKNITLEVRKGFQEPVICGQRELLEVLLGNVIGNAAKYTPEGGTIDIFLEPKGLVIQNSGPDIAATDAARLGERFFRPSGQKEPGSGLGLSIAKRIAGLHGLSLSIDLAPGLFKLKIEGKGVQGPAGGESGWATD